MLRGNDYLVKAQRRPEAGVPSQIAPKTNLSANGRESTQIKTFIRERR